ncbi:MAG: hypothetical protein U0746_03670 [Gemmataceae bacterium]
MTSPNAVHQGLRAVVARRATAALALVLLAASPAPSRQTDRMPDEAIRQWRAYLDGLASHPGMTVETDADARGPDGSPVGDPVRGRLMIRPGAASDDNSRDEAPKYGQEVLATNALYGFRIQRKRADAAWRLADAAPNNGSREFWEHFPIGDGVETVVKAGVTLCASGEVLPDLANDKEFVVTGVAPETHDGESLMRVTFRNTPRYIPRGTDPTSPRPPRQINIVSGYVLLDPKRYWLIHSYVARVNWGMPGQSERLQDVTGTYTYGILRGGLPVVERLEHRFEHGTAVGVRNFVRTAVYRYDETVPAESEFRLPKYGLPDPFNVRRPIRWYIWALAAAVVLFTAAVVLRRLANRRAVAAP